MKSNQTMLGFGLLAVAAYLLFRKKDGSGQATNNFGAPLNAAPPLNLGASQARTGVNVRPAVTGTPQSSRAASIGQDIQTGAQIAVNATDILKGISSLFKNLFGKKPGSEPPFRDGPNTFDGPVATNVEATNYYLNSPDVTIGADNSEPGSPGIPNRDFGLN